MENNEKYMYPVEELDEIIEQLNRGISPMMSEQMQREVKLRYKELQNESTLDEDYDDEDVVQQKKIMAKVVEQKRRAVAKNDVIIIELSDEQKETLREEMSVSLVRPNPNSAYNTPDEILYSSEERRIVQQKLSSIRNCYYNQTDYTNAVRILMAAVEYSLRNDYPWMSFEEAVSAYNKGEIKFVYCRLPKLYINYHTQITDPDLLKGVITGEIQLRDKDDRPKPTKRNTEYTPVACEYNITGTEDFLNMTKWHNMGYDTPISTILRTKSTVYDRFSLPVNSRFATNLNKNKNDDINMFDWEREGSGLEYFRRVKNIKRGMSDLIREVNSENDGRLNNVLSVNSVEFLNMMKYVDSNTDRDYVPQSNVRPTNPEVLQIEQNILQKIRMSNPNK